MSRGRIQKILPELVFSGFVGMEMWCSAKEPKIPFIGVFLRQWYLNHDILFLKHRGGYHALSKEDHSYQKTDWRRSHD